VREDERVIGIECVKGSGMDVSERRLAQMELNSRGERELRER